MCVEQVHVYQKLRALRNVNVVGHNPGRDAPVLRIGLERMWVMPG